MPTPVIVGGVVAVALAGVGVYMSNRIEVCHVTGSETEPWKVIKVSERSWPAHEAHGDKTPVPAGGCDALDGPPAPPGGEV